MTRAPGAQTLLLAVAAGVLLVEGVRCAGAADARHAAAVHVADSAGAAALASVARRREAARAAGRVYVGTVAPHEATMRATDRQLARASAAVVRAGTARAEAERVLADSSATLRELRVELRRSVDVIADLQGQVVALTDTLRQERAAAAQRLAAARAEVAALQVLDTASLALDAARERQVAVRDARRPWWRRALAHACTVAVGGAGAGLGAVVGGVRGAIAGGAGGAGVGLAACR